MDEVTLNLSMLYSFMKDRVAGNLDRAPVVIVKGSGLVKSNSKVRKQLPELHNHNIGGRHGLVLVLSYRVRDHLLLIALPGDKGVYAEPNSGATINRIPHPIDIGVSSDDQWGSNRGKQ